MDPFGKPPIPLPMLILGKLAVFVCWMFFLAKTTGFYTMLYDSPVTRTAAYVLAALGFTILVLGFIFLGRSVSVGFPQEETELKTRGIYRFTRNPLYLGGFFVCAASCLFSIHLVNFLLCAMAIAIHHWIVTKEEVFLENRFGQQWRDYKRRVPRYIGIISRS